MPTESAMSHRGGRLVLVLTLTVAACGVPTTSRWEPSQPEPVAAADIGAPPQRFEIERAPTVEDREIRARLVPASEEAAVAPSGGRVDRLLVATGAAVTAGQPVIEWSSGAEDPSVQLRSQILELEIALAELEDRPSDVERLTDELAEVRSLPAADVATIVSPATGVLGRFVVGRFSVFEAGDELFTVGPPTPTRVDLDLSDAERRGLEVGGVVAVTVLRDRLADPVAATIRSIREMSSEDPAAARRWAVDAVLDPGAAGAVGDRVVVDIDATSGDGLRVAAAAVLDDGRGPFVLVDDGVTWTRVDLEIGLRTDEFVEILSDLAPGTQVVVP